jgi:hypothetical protein
MTRLLEQVLAAVSGLPEADQDKVARMVLRFVNEELSPVQLTPEEEAELAKAEREVQRGERACNEEITALWAKNGA